MDFIKTLVKLLNSKPIWMIDVDQEQSYNDDDNMKDRKIIFKVRRWNKLGLYSRTILYSDIADFDTLSEAHEFVGRYKNFPLDADGVY